VKVKVVVEAEGTADDSAKVYLLDTRRISTERD